MRFTLHGAVLREFGWHGHLPSSGCQWWWSLSGLQNHPVVAVLSQLRAPFSSAPAPSSSSVLHPTSSPAAGSTSPQEDAVPGARQYDLRLHKLPEYQMDAEEAVQLQSATGIITSLQQAGHQAYVAGGWVRDKFLGRPAHDVDIATSASAIQVGKMFASKDVLARQTVRVRPASGGSFEVTTFRGHSRVGKAPPLGAAATAAAAPAAVEGELWQQHAAARAADPMHSAYLDAALRDFSVNSLFYDPVTQDVLDFVGGVDDIRSRVLRVNRTPREYAVSPGSGLHWMLGEDPIRVLRALRFSVTLPGSFRLDSETERLMKTYGPKCSVDKGVSPSRLYRELAKMEGKPGGFAEGMALAHRLGLLNHLFPFLRAQGDEATQRGLAVVRLLGPAVPLTLRVAALLKPKPKVNSKVSSIYSEMASAIQSAPGVHRHHVVTLEKMLDLVLRGSDRRDDWAPVYAMEGSQDCLQILALWSPAPVRSAFHQHHKQRQRQWQEAISAAAAVGAAAAASRPPPPASSRQRAEVDPALELARQRRAAASAAEREREVAKQEAARAAGLAALGLPVKRTKPAP